MISAQFYLICFAAGFLFSLASFLVGALHWHLPHIGHHHLPATHHGHGTHVSILNPMTLAAFLAWFGGTGYLLTRYSTIWFVIGLAIAVLSGIAGAAIIYFFLTRILTSKDENMDAANYQMIGVLGRISVPIREGGTGEIIYSQAGTRRTCGARADNGGTMPKNSEVVVIRYEKGIAYVRLYEELARGRPAATDVILSHLDSEGEK